LFKNYSFISGPAMMNIPESQMAAKVCNSEIDALAIITAHPSLLVNSIFNLCNIDFISIDLLRLDGIVQSNNIYSQGIIDPSLYNKTSHSSNTLVMKSVLVTSAQVPYDKINILQNTLRLQFDAFVASHPALKSLDKTKVFDQNQYIIPSYY
ncbi:MAG: TAXI family TRAP transporter solute-binding subunit, partial [Rickettsiaceae bacterium]|nr:TAXI family TRAP transporter solute-binding subunit [Rickettsiaceae bacterium]